MEYTNAPKSLKSSYSHQQLTPAGGSAKKQKRVVFNLDSSMKSFNTHDDPTNFSFRPYSTTSVQPASLQINQQTYQHPDNDDDDDDDELDRGETLFKSRHSMKGSLSSS
jgi:hypothetical protein